MYAGDEVGDLTGEPVLTTVEGYISAWTADGVTCGDFSISDFVIASDAEEVVSS